MQRTVQLYGSFLMEHRHRTFVDNGCSPCYNLVKVPKRELREVLRMKRFLCMIAAAWMLLSCAAADTLTDLFGAFEHLSVVQDSTYGACMVKPKASAMTAYASDHNVFLPVFGQSEDELKACVVMKGAGIMFQPHHVLVVTEQYQYRMDLKAERPTMFSIEGSSYVAFLLPSDMMEMCRDIADSGTVTVRYSMDSTHSGTNDFQLSQDVKDIFGAVYEVYMAYDALLDNRETVRAIDEQAYSYIDYKREANPAAVRE